jgi:hypothetical protein
MIAAEEKDRFHIFAVPLEAWRPKSILPGVKHEDL